MTSLWHDQGTVYGMAVKAVFFNNEQAAAQPDLARRAMPFFARATPRPVIVDNDRQTLLLGQLVVKPSHLFDHNGGFISVECASMQGPTHTLGDWRTKIQMKDMLKCVIAGYAVAQRYRKLTACVLRYPGACYLVAPGRGQVRALLELVPRVLMTKTNATIVSSEELVEFAVSSQPKA